MYVLFVPFSLKVLYAVDDFNSFFMKTSIRNKDKEYVQFYFDFVLYFFWLLHILYQNGCLTLFCTHHYFIISQLVVSCICAKCVLKN